LHASAPWQHCAPAQPFAGGRQGVVVSPALHWATRSAQTKLKQLAEQQSLSWAQMAPAAKQPNSAAQMWLSQCCEQHWLACRQGRPLALQDWPGF
jgi:hypothetical protein